MSQAQVTTSGDTHLENPMGVAIAVRLRRHRVVDMFLTIPIAGQGKADQIQNTLTLLRGLLIPFKRERPELTTPHAVASNEFDEADPGKIRFLHRQPPDGTASYIG